MATAQYYGTGRRKTSTARVFLRPGTGAITINRRPIDTAFPTETLRLVIRQPLVVIAPHLRLHTQLAQVLDQVEHEAVVVVDDQDLRHRDRLPGEGQPSGRAYFMRTGSV